MQLDRWRIEGISARSLPANLATSSVLLSFDPSIGRYANRDGIIITIIMGMNNMYNKGTMEFTAEKNKKKFQQRPPSSLLNNVKKLLDR